MPASSLLAVFRSFTSVQLEPFQLSVAPVLPGEASPPKARDDVLSAPQPPSKLLAVFTSATSVQAEPFQLSTSDALAVPV
jgi:hypothetical protein